jgi:hypothetical protein
MRTALGVLALVAVAVVVTVLLSGCPSGPKPPEGSSVTPETEPAPAVAPEGDEADEAATPTADEKTEEGADAADGEATEETPAADGAADEKADDAAPADDAADDADGDEKTEDKGTE